MLASSACIFSFCPVTEEAVALIPSSLDTTFTSPPEIFTSLPSRPSLLWVMLILPPTISRFVPAWIPSSAAFIVIVPPSMYTKPLLVSSLFSEWIPSVPVVILIVPSAILTLSFPLMPFFVDVMSIFPPVITTSSLPTTP